MNVQLYEEGGVVFTPLNTNPGAAFIRFGGGVGPAPENGTAYLQASLGQSLKFSFTDGSLFDLNSIDIAEYSTLFPSSLTVHFVCYKQDGGVLTKDFITDGIIDGTGPMADFETFYCGPELSSLTKVEIPDYGWSLDNLKLSVQVPEPSGGALLVLASAGLFFTRRLHKR